LWKIALERKLNRSEVFIKSLEKQGFKEIDSLAQAVKELKIGDEFTSWLSKIPLSTDPLEMLYLKTLATSKSGNNAKCCICISDYTAEPKRPIARVNCEAQHLFHTDCINFWRKTKDTCPSCRCEISRLIPTPLSGTRLC